MEKTNTQKTTRSIFKVKPVAYNPALVLKQGCSCGNGGGNGVK